MISIQLASFSRPDPQLIERLRPYHVADVVNGGAGRFAGGAIRPVFKGACLIGTAFTAKVDPGDNAGVIAAAMSAEPGDVIVVDAGEQPTCAMVGGLLGRLAKSRRLAGFVVNGSVRDLDDLEALSVPVFAREISPLRAQKNGPAILGRKVACGIAEVNPGDLVLADCDGVIFMDAHSAEAAWPNIARGKEAERRLDDPKNLAELFGGLLSKMDIQRG